MNIWPFLLPGSFASVFQKWIILFTQVCLSKEGLKAVQVGLFNVSVYAKEGLKAVQVGLFNVSVYARGSKRCHTGGKFCLGGYILEKDNSGCLLLV